MMITINNFNDELISTMSDYHKKVLVDFANNFLDTFGDCISEEVLLNRLNKLKYIGFERPENIIERCNTCDAQFIEGKNPLVVISLNNKNASEEKIKSLLYHELIHAVSYHYERDLDSKYNQYPTYRIGLFRESVEYDTDGPGFSEGSILEEIMTEYYNVVLLQKEGIDFNGTYTLRRDMFTEDFVEYHGTGYYLTVGLGQIYDLLFGKKLLMAKLHDGNDFRTEFNEIFNKTDVFKGKFEDEDCEVPSYSKFVAEKNVYDRYSSACKMFITLIKEKYKDQINNINDLLQLEDLSKFMSMLIKTRYRGDDNANIQSYLYLLIKNLEKDLAHEFFGNQIQENEYGRDTEDIDLAVFIAIEDIKKSEPSIDTSNLKYSVFYDKRFKGVLLQVDNQYYVFDYRSIGQEFGYTKFKKFTESDFSEEELQYYSEQYKMDVKDASYATVSAALNRATFIMKDNVLYNHYGNPLPLNGMKSYYEDSIKQDNQIKK